MITPSIRTKIVVTQGRNSDGPSNLVTTIRGSTILTTLCKRLGNIFAGYCISYSSWQTQPNSWIAIASALPLRPYVLASRTHSYSPTSTPRSTQQLSTIPLFSRLPFSCLRSFIIKNRSIRTLGPAKTSYNVTRFYQFCEGREITP